MDVSVFLVVRGAALRVRGGKTDFLSSWSVFSRKAANGRQLCVMIRRMGMPRDVMRPRQKEEKTEMSVQDYNEALNVAMDDIVRKRYEYRRRYEQWLK